MNIKDHVIFKECAEKIKDQCYARLQEECEGLDKEGRERAESRLSQEIDIVNRYGYSNGFYLSKLIMEYAKSKRRLAFIGGLSAYSYVAYLLGITDINPLWAGYHPEIAFSPKWDYNPFGAVRVSIPQGFDEDVINYIRTFFGNGFVRKEEEELLLADWNQQDKTGSPDMMYISLDANDMVTKADEIIASKGGRDSDEIFLKERNAVFLRKDMFHSMALDSKYVDAMHEVAAGKANLSDPVFFTRDELYQYGLELFGGSADLAYDLMSMVRKGRGGRPKTQELLEKYGADEMIRDQLSRIRYLVSEGACIPEMQLAEYSANHMVIA